MRGVDVIACEDTRITARLLAAHGITTPMTPYHEHNAERARPKLLARLEREEAVALVSDAGTPLIADPGYRLVRAAIDADIAVTVVPGPAAPLAALVVSGLPTDRFLFAGFLPPRAAARSSALKRLADVDATLIFLESTRRLPAALAAMAEILGSRAGAVAREITKLHEEVRRDSLTALAAHYAEAGPPRGEAVVVVAPPTRGADLRDDLAGTDIDIMLREALVDSSVRDAAAAVTATTGRPRRELYQRALLLAAESTNGNFEDLR